MTEVVVTRRATDHHARVAACGEGTSTFWSHAHVEAAIHIEQQLDEIAMRRQMDILCAYPLAARDESVPAVRRLCAEIRPSRSADGGGMMVWKVGFQHGRIRDRSSG